jgi:hypothetical protein
LLFIIHCFISRNKNNHLHGSKENKYLITIL